MYYIRRMTPIAAAILTLLVVGAAGFFTVSQLKNETSKIVDGTFPRLAHAGEINSYQAENFIRAILVITAENPKDRDVYLKDIEAITGKIDQSINQYQMLIRTEEDRRIFERLVSERNEYRKIRDEAFALAANGQREQALSVLNTALFPAYKQYTDTGDGLFDYSFREGDVRGKRILGVCTTTQFLVAVVGVVVFIAGFLTPFLVIRFSGSPEVAR